MRRPGFTLMEIVVVLLLVAILTSALAMVVTLSLNYWSKVDQRVQAERNVRIAINSIVTEMREAIVCPDDGASGNTPRGYLGLTPPVARTAILYPNANSTTGGQVWFTEQVPNYDPFANGMDPSSAQFYQQVRYHVGSVIGGSLSREVTTFDATGNIVSVNDVPLAQPTSTGSIVITATWLSPTTINLNVQAVEGRFGYELQSNVFSQ